MSALLISVITTAYNVGPYIAAAMRSALAQTVSDLELLVIDDASTDDTWEQATAVNDPRVRLLRCSHRGAAGAGNYGLEHARGDFIAFLDGDDLWLPRNLERQLATMRAHPDCEMTFALSRMVDEAGGDLGPTSRVAREPLGERELLQENYCANGSAVMLRRSTVERVGPFATEIGASFDYDYWLRVSHGRGRNVWCVPEVLVQYRRRGGQVTGRWQRMAEGWEQVLRRAQQRDPVLAAAATPVGTMNMKRYFAYLALDAGEWSSAWRLLAEGFGSAPGRFLLERRNFLVAGGLMAKAVLPGSWYAGLERRVR